MSEEDKAAEAAEAAVRSNDIKSIPSPSAAVDVLPPTDDHCTGTPPKTVVPLQKRKAATTVKKRARLSHSESLAHAQQQRRRSLRVRRLEA